MFSHLRKEFERLKAGVLDGLTGNSLTAGLAAAAEAVQEVVTILAREDVPGEEKKKAAVAFWDEVVAAILAATDGPGPDMIVDPLLAKGLHYAGAALIEGIYQFLKKRGWLVS